MKYKEVCCFCNKEIDDEEDCGKYTVKTELPGNPSSLFVCTEYNMCKKCVQKFFRWAKENPSYTVDMVKDFFDKLSEGNGDN